MLKTGTRLKSQVDKTQIIVIKSSDSLDDLRCGGSPMVDLSVNGSPAEVATSLTDGTVMGKRYVSDDGAEVLVTKAGRGTLTVGTTALSIKDAKPLPASD